jgi:hypothetical protein
MMHLFLLIIVIVDATLFLLSVIYNSIFSVAMVNSGLQFLCRMKILENSEAPFSFVFAIVCWRLTRKGWSDHVGEAVQGTYLLASIRKF